MKTKRVATWVGVATAVIVMGSAMQAGAISFTIGDADPNYVGSVVKATPSNPSDEISYINYLIGMTTSSTNYNAVGDNDMTRSDNVIVGLQPATVAGAYKEEPPDNAEYEIAGAGYDYLYAKYGSIAHVWYIGNTTAAFDWPADALSHFSLYDTTSDGSRLPDGGTTLILLGAAVSGLGLISRKLR